MKKYLIFFLVFLFLGTLYSDESPLPEIKRGIYEIEYRKGKTYFVDLFYEVEIQGTNRLYDGWLKIVLYNEKDEEIESFGRQVEIKPKELQNFIGRQMIMIKVANKIKRIRFDLKFYQKKY